MNVKIKTHSFTYLRSFITVCTNKWGNNEFSAMFMNDGT